MSVAKPDRKKSKTEFDRVYYAILADSLQITKNCFGASKEKRAEYAEYIRNMCNRVDRVVADIGTHIRIANSIFPKEPDIQREAKERRVHQEKAIGLCFDLLTKIVKLSHGFTYMQIKYSIDGKKIIKRPCRKKVTRERRRLKKHRNLLDKGVVDKIYIYI